MSAKEGKARRLRKIGFQIFNHLFFVKFHLPQMQDNLGTVPYEEGAETFDTLYTADKNVHYILNILKFSFRISLKTYWPRRNNWKTFNTHTLRFL